jgi:hypothetical protein
MKETENTKTPVTGDMSYQDKQVRQYQPPATKMFSLSGGKPPVAKMGDGSENPTFGGSGGTGFPRGYGDGSIGAARKKTGADRDFGPTKTGQD